MPNDCDIFISISTDSAYTHNFITGRFFKTVCTCQDNGSHQQTHIKNRSVTHDITISKQSPPLITGTVLQPHDFTGDLFT